MTVRQLRSLRLFGRRVRRRERRRPSRGRVVVFGGKGFPQVEAAGGVERGIQHLTKRLAALGVECLVYERSPRPSWRREGRVLVRGLPFINRKNHVHWSHAWLSFFDYLAYRRRGDVVHVHNILNSWLCLPLRLLGHRVLFHLHGQEWRAAKWGPMMSLLMRLSILPMVYGAHVVVTVCEESRRLLSARFPRRATRIVCIPNGLPGPTRSATRSHAPFLADHGLAPDAFFLFAGRLVPQKRVELIVQALALSGSSFPLVLAGTGSYSTGYVATLEAEVRRRGLDGRVFFLGQLDWEQLRHLYANCRAVVHPSDSEGCSNTLLEAIATGTCVVCSDLPENRSLLGDAGLYIGRGDVDGLATTLRALEREGSVAERRRMVVARQRRLRSWDEIAPEFHRMYWPRPSDRPLKAARPAATLGVTRSDAA